MLAEAPSSFGDLAPYLDLAEPLLSLVYLGGGHTSSWSRQRVCKLT